MLLWKVQNSQQNLLKHSTKINGRVIKKKKKKSPCALMLRQWIILFSKRSLSKFYVFP